jgi:hypothetical protein
VEHELILGREEFPIEEVLQLAAVDGQEFGARQEPKLRGDRSGLDCGDFDHEKPSTPGRTSEKKR